MSTSELRILVLDDDKAVVDTICAMARRVGAKARGETRAEPFLVCVDTWRPEFIVLDMLMPELDGVEIIRALAERGCEAALILSSGVDNKVLEAARRTATERGLVVAGIISKPLTRANLRHAIESAPTHAPRADRTGRASAVTIPELQQALDRDEIELAFQPQIDCVSGELAGFEALARWHHPDRGLILPDRFITVAERGGLITLLTDRIVDRALDTFATQITDGAIGLSINLSMADLMDLSFADRVAVRCRNLGIAPRLITFELTETGAMEDPASALDLLTRLRIKGFRLSIDDFGTGYSSMVQLVRLPFTEIKIDRSFVSSAHISAESLEVVRSVVALGKGLGLEIVAEGVEDAQMFAHVSALGCDRAQGYHFGLPLRPDGIASWKMLWPKRKSAQATVQGSATG